MTLTLTGDQGTHAINDNDDRMKRQAEEGIHLRQELVERLFAFVVASTDAGTALAADGINFVDEDQARAVLLGFLEQIADAAGTHANEHLNELRTRKGEEGQAPQEGQAAWCGSGRRAGSARQPDGRTRACGLEPEALAGPRAPNRS